MSIPVNEAKKEKRQLEETIRNQIAQFEEKTGVVVDSVALERVYTRAIDREQEEPLELVAVQLSLTI